MRKILFLYIPFLLFLFFQKVHAYEFSKNKIVNLSLDEAILLAIRTNPNVQTTKLNYVMAKFSTWVKQWEFYPHYFLDATVSTNRKRDLDGWVGGHNYNVQPSVSLLTPIGTEFTLNANNSKTINYNPGVTLSFIQPLMRGFGKPIVEASLNNAKDSERVSKLTIENVLRTTVSDVITAYLGVVSAERTISIDEDAVKRAKTSVEQTKLFIKAGRKAGNELVTVEANVASAEAILENDKNGLLQARYALLKAIGLDPNSNVKFSTLDVEKLTHKYQLPTLAHTKKMTLANDIQYQTEIITLYGQQQRNLLVAEDNTRWKLNLKGEIGTGGGDGKGKSAGWNSLFNGVNQSQSISLTLQIPIDDQTSKQAVLNAKIAIKQARLALLQDKWNKETDAINGWNNVISAEKALKFAENAEVLQEKTYNVSYQKYLHGLIDSLELQTALLSLIQSKQLLLAAKIRYLLALVNLDRLIGHTLKTWNIKTR